MHNYANDFSYNRVLIIRFTTLLYYTFITEQHNTSREFTYFRYIIVIQLVLLENDNVLIYNKLGYYFIKQIIMKNYN